MAPAITPPSNKQPLSAFRIGIKALCLLIVFNFLMIWVDPLPLLGRISIYNRLVPGRERLPYGEQPEKSYNLNLYQLDAMFNAHEIAGAVKSPNEFRVILIGDSSTWGFLLSSKETLASAINAKNALTSDGRQITAYNLGYPVMSLTKDLLILSRSMPYQPDLVIWLVTLESFPYDKQLFPPLLQHNRQEVLELIQSNHLNMDRYISELEKPSIWDKTLLGQRRNLADIFRLQMYGVMWAATGIDQDIPSTFERPMEDLPVDQSFHDLKPPHLSENDLAFDILNAGVNLAMDTPVMIVNEPMYISHGLNSDIRYNYYYPRWAYDDYRQMLASRCNSSQWNCVDLWNSIESSQFSNTAVHLTPNGVRQTADYLIDEMIATGNP
jgi:hypothetical protein